MAVGKGGRTQDGYRGLLAGVVYTLADVTNVYLRLTLRKTLSGNLALSAGDS